ncbi:MAG: hypothetical protein LBL06_04190 [Treponema sp.]|jgi:hypothetical protein|nr:hypothetical protein [Treponema sp.]
MLMYKAIAFFLIVFCLFPTFAQDEEEVPIEEWDVEAPSLYTSGEQNFAISVGLVLPLFFNGREGQTVNNVNAGSMLSLAYNYYLASHFFLGGEIGGMFAATLGENMLYIVPFGLRIGYEFVLGRFEFPFSVMFGAATQKYLETDYFGFFLKPMVSIFFRFSPDWSFGLNSAWWIVPEWVSESRKDITGHFLEITISVKYHF